MTPLALALVLLSAVAHAGWNYLTKKSSDTLVFSWCFTALASVLYLPFLLAVLQRSSVPPAGWLFVAGTMALHIVYFHLLNSAYTHGDLSLVYPVARGTGIALIPIGGSLLLGETVSLPAALAMAAILFGVLAVNRGASWRTLTAAFAEKGSRFALATGLLIASYTLWDKQALSLVPPLVLIYASFFGQALTATPLVLRRPIALRREIRERKRAILAAAVFAPLAYLLVLYALTFSRVSYVGPAREISIVVGAALGTLALGEPYGRGRLIGSAVIVAGVLALALAP